MENSNHKPFFIAATILLIAQFVQIFLRGFIDHPLLAIAYPLVVTPFAFWHGILRYGVKKMTIFFCIVFAVGWSFESLSVAIGFPFGNYYYTDLLGFKLGTVPISVMPAYFAFGYVSWVVADVILSKRDNTIKGWELLSIPAVSAFAMSAWDLMSDPVNSTYRPMWVWEEGGPFFGVPTSNFLGWYFVVFVFYFLFALYNRRHNEDPTPEIVNNKWYWIVAVLMFVFVMIENFTGYLWRESILVKSLDGHEWWSGDIYGSMLLVALWTILPIGLYALLRINRDFN